MPRPRQYPTNADRQRAYRQRQRRQRQVLFTSQRQDWSTPQDDFAALDAEFRFTLDVAASPDNAKCPRFFTKDQDGLAQDWGREVCWMNPPYNQVARWMSKALESSQAGALVVCFVYARTGTAWWHTYATRGEIRFLRGRRKFSGAQFNAPADSAVVIFRPPA